MVSMGRDLKNSIKDIAKNVSVTLNNITPKINVDLSGIDKGLDDLDYQPKNQH